MKKKLRQFSFLIGIGLPLFIGIIIPLLTGHAFRTWTIWAALPILLLGIIAPRVLYYPYKGWMALGDCLSFVNSRVILGLVFLIILQPIALIMRILRYDPLRKKKSHLL